MCGFLGGNFFSSEEEAKELLKNIIHRGRDNSTVKKLENFFFCHNRLSIQDLSEHGNQPMANDDESIWIIYNGEIWDSKPTKDLKKKLSKKYTFKSSCDTEIILHGYEEYGVDIFEKLDGMFSLAIYDLNKQQILMARDWLGKLPYYYFHVGEQIGFCSEMKGLPLGRLSKKDIKTMPPSHYMIYDITDNVLNEPVKYYELPKQEVTDDEETIIKTIRELLEEGVKNRLISDVPVCTIMSGGIDSVVITYLLKQYIPDIEAFVVSMDNDSSKKNDLYYARVAAEHMGIKLNEIIIDEQYVKDHIEDTLKAIEIPRWVNIGSAIAQIAMSKEISDRGFKVVFGGDMSDEIWGSYDTTKRFNWKDDQYDNARRTLVRNVHKNNLISCNISMLYGGTVELRTPFAHRPFVEYAINVPIKYREMKKRMKPLLRLAFDNELPEEILWRKKIPFTTGCNTMDIVRPPANNKNIYKEMLEETMGFQKENTLEDLFD
jgi:asparagine synthase (glutamine-hydrolysing)